MEEPTEGPNQVDSVGSNPPQINTPLPRGLPVELLDRIASFVFGLSSNSPLAAFSLSCRLFYRVACRHVYRSICIPFEFDDPDLPCLPTKIRFLLTTPRLHHLIRDITVTFGPLMAFDLEYNLKQLAQLISRCTHLDVLVFGGREDAVIRLPTALVAAIGTLNQLRMLVFVNVTISARWPSRFAFQSQLKQLKLHGRVGKLVRLLQFTKPRVLLLDEVACTAISTCCKELPIGFRSVTTLDLKLTSLRESAHRGRCEGVLAGASGLETLHSFNINLTSAEEARLFANLRFPQVRSVNVTGEAAHGWPEAFDILGRAFPEIFMMAIYLPHWDPPPELDESVLGVSRFFPGLAMLDLSTGPAGLEEPNHLIAKSNREEIEADIDEIFRRRPQLWYLKYRHGLNTFAVACLAAMAPMCLSDMKDAIRSSEGHCVTRLVESPPLSILIKSNPWLLQSA